MGREQGLRFIRKWEDGWRLVMELLTVDISHLQSWSVGRRHLLELSDSYPPPTLTELQMTRVVFT